MIRCSHCGKLAPSGAMSCQHCGMPLVNNTGSIAGTGQPEQQELPAWLESLRTQERPASSSLGNVPPFAMNELVDENSMPRWMLQDQSHMAEGGFSGAMPVLKPNTQPELNTAQPAFPGSGLEAGSLIDERSLPAWMRGSQESTPQSFGQGFSAHSLVDQQALPPWIKDLAQTAQPQTAPEAEQRYTLPPQPPMTPPSLTSIPPYVPQTPSTPPRNEPQTPPMQNFSAHDLLDQRSMPSWMSNEAQAPAFPPQNKPVPTGMGFQAGELIDQRSVPPWMKEQQGQEQSHPASALGMPVNGSGQGMDRGQVDEGMPASMLVDQGSMPPWMRANEQGIPPSGGMSAGSLIDKEALPPWLRNSNESQQNTGPQSVSSPGMRARQEGTRVPSRPRNDSSGQGQSEVAANIFSSLLGVSASMPVMPGQTPLSNLGVAQGQPAQYPQGGQPPIPAWQPPAGADQAAQPQPWQMAGPTPNAYVPGNTGGIAMQANMAQQNAYPMPPTARGDGSVPGAWSVPNSEAQAAPAKKKGFFEIIRAFFK